MIIFCKLGNGFLIIKHQIILHFRKFCWNNFSWKIFKYRILELFQKVLNLKLKYSDKTCFTASFYVIAAKWKMNILFLSTIFLNFDYYFQTCAIMSFSGFFFWTIFIYFVWLTENVDFECFIRFDRLTSGVKMKNWPIQELAQFGLSESFHNWFIRISGSFQENYQSSNKTFNLK